MDKPVLVKPIPSQIVNERASFGPLNLTEYIAAPDGSACRFTMELDSGEALPKGMIGTSDGIVTGIPGRDTQSTYVVIVTAENEAGSIQTSFTFTIKPSLATDDDTYFDKLKAQVWEALEKHLPPPDFAELYNRPVSIVEIYHLLERWGLIKVWDAFNLEPPGEMIPLNLEGVSKHYVVYDRGSCIVACPKDLFSHERTLEDGIQTAKAVAREVYKRKWPVEIAGFDKLTRALWLELQHLGDVHGHRLEITNYIPSVSDLRLYTMQAEEIRMRAAPNV